jgi:hypothetical protein
MSVRRRVQSPARLAVLQVFAQQLAKQLAAPRRCRVVIRRIQFRRGASAEPTVESSPRRAACIAAMVVAPGV